jgi:hypothetical protein
MRRGERREESAVAELRVLLTWSLGGGDTRGTFTGSYDLLDQFFNTSTRI